MSSEKSCGAIVFRKNCEAEYLLLLYEGLSGREYWDFVKGLVEPNESEKETVMRELKEETGITKAEFVEGFREEISYFYRRAGKTIHKKVVFFLVQALNSQVKLSYEHKGYEWFGYQEAIKKLSFTNSRNVFKKVKGLMD